MQLLEREKAEGAIIAATGAEVEACQFEDFASVRLDQPGASATFFDGKNTGQHRVVFLHRVTDVTSTVDEHGVTVLAVKQADGTSAMIYLMP